MLRVTDRLWTAIDYPGLPPERARHAARFIRYQEGPPLETGAPYLAQQITPVTDPVGTTPFVSSIGTGIGIAVGLSIVGVAIWAVSAVSGAARR